MQISGLQFDMAWEDGERNVATVQEWAARASFESGGLIVLPEMFSSGFSMNVEKTGAASCVEAATDCLRALAAKNACAVIGGVAEKSMDGEERGSNLSLSFSPAGDALARYTKIRTFSYTRESEHYRRGEDLSLFGWQGWKICPLICYDLRFPELFRRGAGLGAELFVVIASWPSVRVDHWLTLLRARAIENQAYVVGVNRTGTDPSLDYPGRSVVIDPWGEIVADAGSEDGWVQAEIDHQKLLDWRAEFPALADRLEI